MPLAQPELIDPTGKPFVVPQAIAVRTAQAQATGLFYRSLGLVVERQQANDGRPFLTAKCSGLLLKITLAEIPGDPRETLLHLGVDDLEAVLKQAAGVKAAVLKPPHDSSWGRRAILADPDGRRVVLTERGGAMPQIAGIQNGASATSARIAASYESHDDENTDEQSQDVNREIMRAYASVKRGAGIILVGMTMTFLSFLVMVYFVVENPARFRDSARAAKDPIVYDLSMVILGSIVVGFFGKFQCLFPKTRRVDYTGLTAAIVLQTAVFGTSLLTSMLPLPAYQKIHVVLTVANVLVPLLFLSFLVQMTQVARNPPLTWIAELTLRCYIVLLLTMGLFFGLIFVSPVAAGVFSWGAGLVLLVFVGSYVTLLVRLIMSSPQIT